MLNSLKNGLLVAFTPPERAYSGESRQQQFAGQRGVIYHVWNDGYAHVMFGRQLVLCNTAYLFDVAAPVAAGRGWSRWAGYSEKGGWLWAIRA